MQLRTLSSLVLIYISLTPSWGAYGATQTYDNYITSATEYCDSSDRTWFQDNTLVAKIDYPAFETNIVNITMAKWRNNPQVIGDEKIRLKSDLDMVRIGEFRGFKTLEVARIGYRSQMNALFACSVISSRIDTIDTLQKLIDKKISSKESEIRQKLKKEADRLKKNLTTLKCNPPKSSDERKKGEMIVSLTNTATHKYCYYRHYLGYLDSNIVDVTRTQNIEKGIGTGNGTTVSTVTSSWNSASLRYQSALSQEMIRADTTLPKAIRSLIEMDQTYGAHILLTIIYDDYIRLRKSLSSYMNISSQLYQKANNAQNANQQ
ncbi:hypothetical protein H7169_01555 [Candidatus Gracilibacteria bacterium]|nr:hypothetical protein [Candidatus Gracilibacteria bacterium]